MLKTFALIAHLSVTPGQTDMYVIDYGMSHEDCIAAITQPVHKVELGDNAFIIIEGEQSLSCEAE